MNSSRSAGSMRSWDANREQIFAHRSASIGKAPLAAAGQVHDVGAGRCLTEKVASRFGVPEFLLGAVAGAEFVRPPEWDRMTARPR